MLTKEKVYELLELVKDPELPVVSIVEMGMVTDVKVEEKKAIIFLTPTYSGCPAMKMIEDEIADVLSKENLDKIEIKKTYAPAWTTDWLTTEARKKLKEFGIAPPKNIHCTPEDDEEMFKEIECPYCDSKNTKLTSEFSSTACKSLHYCDSCCQPFEHFKCI